MDALNQSTGDGDTATRDSLTEVNALERANHLDGVEGRPGKEKAEQLGVGWVNGAHRRLGRVGEGR